MGLLELPSESLSTCGRMEGDSAAGRNGNPAIISPGHSPPLLFFPAVCCFFISVSRSAIHCCRTDDHTLNGFMKHTFIISPLLWVRSPGLLCWVLLTGLTSRCRLGLPVSRFRWRKAASKIMCLLAECSSLWPIGLRVSVFMLADRWKQPSVFSGMFVEGCPQFFVTWAF